MVQSSWNRVGRGKRCSRCQFPGREIVLRNHPEGIRDAVEESEQSGNIHRLGDLLFLPTGIAKFLHVRRGGTGSDLGNQLNIFEQRTLRRRKASFIELAFDDCLYALIGGSLNPQEVSMAVQSIRAPVQIGNVTGDHFLVPPRKVSFGEMHGVRELKHLAQEIGPRAETLDNAGDLFSP